MTKPASHQHIALFFSNFHGGGIQRVMLCLADGLVRHDWRVDLVVVDGSGPLRNEIPSDCHLFDLRTAHVSRSLRLLARYLRSEKPAVLLSAQTHFNVTAVLARILSGWKGRLLLSEHIALDYMADNPFRWQERFFPLLAKLFYRRADKIILVSKDAARRFLEITHLPEKMVTVIYNPIVSDTLFAHAKLQPTHAWLQKKGPPIFLGAGRLTLQKNFNLLLKAFAMLRLQISDAKLLILGVGEEKAALQTLAVELGIAEAVDFPGFVQNPYAVMANVSVFVLSSRWEGFGNVLVEAMACGTPVVSTNCPSGPAEILRDGEYGLLVPVDDPDLLAEAMIREWKSPHDPQKLIQRALDFEIEKILPQYIECMAPGLGGEQ